MNKKINILPLSKIAIYGTIIFLVILISGAIGCDTPSKTSTTSTGFELQSISGNNGYTLVLKFTKPLSAVYSEKMKITFSTVSEIDASTENQKIDLDSTKTYQLTANKAWYRDNTVYVTVPPLINAGSFVAITLDAQAVYDTSNPPQANIKMTKPLAGEIATNPTPPTLVYADIVGPNTPLLLFFSEKISLGPNTYSAGADGSLIVKSGDKSSDLIAAAAVENVDTSLTLADEGDLEQVGQTGYAVKVALTTPLVDKQWVIIDVKEGIVKDGVGVSGNLAIAATSNTIYQVSAYNNDAAPTLQSVVANDGKTVVLTFSEPLLSVNPSGIKIASGTDSEGAKGATYAPATYAWINKIDNRKIYATATTTIAKDQYVAVQLDANAVMDLSKFNNLGNLELTTGLVSPKVISSPPTILYVTAKDKTINVYFSESVTIDNTLNIVGNLATNFRIKYDANKVRAYDSTTGLINLTAVPVLNTNTYILTFTTPITVTLPQGNYVSVEILRPDLIKDVSTPAIGNLANTKVPFIGVGIAE